VREAAGELADRLHLLRLGELLAPRFQRALRLAPLGDVARDLGEAEQRPVLPAEGVEDDAGPESAAVLADPPALLLVPTAARRGGQGALGHARRAVLLGAEAGDVLADGLGGRVALDPTRAGVPVRHGPVRAEHVDRVVGDALDEQAEVPLALGQRRLGAPARGDIDERRDDVGRRPVRLALHTRRDEHVEDRAVAPDEAAGRVAQLRRGGEHRAEDRARRGAAVVLEIADRPADHLVAAVAEQVEPAVGDLDDAARGVEDVQRHRGTDEVGAVAGLARAQRVVRGLQLRAGGQREGPRHQRPERRGGGQRDHRGGGLDEGLGAVGGHPEGEQVEPVAGPAEQDEGGEQPENRAEDQVAAPAREDQERQRDGEVSEADPDVGEGVGPDQPRLPQQTEAVRRQAGGVQEPTG
jgi:hypothetical protein